MFRAARPYKPGARPIAGENPEPYFTLVPMTSIGTDPKTQQLRVVRRSSPSEETVVGREGHKTGTELDDRLGRVRLLLEIRTGDLVSVEVRAFGPPEAIGREGFLRGPSTKQGLRGGPVCGVEVQKSAKPPRRGVANGLMHAPARETKKTSTDDLTQAGPVE